LPFKRREIVNRTFQLLFEVGAILFANLLGFPVILKEERMTDGKWIGLIVVMLIVVVVIGLFRTTHDCRDAL
jgi:hypothetical protein